MVGAADPAFTFRLTGLQGNDTAQNKVHHAADPHQHRLVQNISGR